MAKRRTRKEKAEARHTYGPSYTLSMPDAAAGVSPMAGTVTPVYDERASLTVDTHLIKKDIWKSIVISGIVLALELGIYYYKFY